MLSTTSGRNATKWSPLEEDSCIRAVDRAATTLQKTHDGELQMLQHQQQQQQISSTEGGTPTAPGIPPALQALRTRELDELRLLNDAVHQNDVIGLTTMATTFWSFKNVMCRQKLALERVLPKPDETEELLSCLRELQIAAENPTESASVSRLIDTVQRASFVDLCRHATELQRRVCEMAPIVASAQAMGIDGVGSIFGGTIGAGAVGRTLMQTDEQADDRLGEIVRVADASLQDAQLRAEMLRENIQQVFDGFEQLKLPRSMHSFLPTAARQQLAQLGGAASGITLADGSSPVPRPVPGGSIASPNPIKRPGDVSALVAAEATAHTTFHMLRVQLAQARPGDTAHSIAERFEVDDGAVTDLHQHPLAPDFIFVEPTDVLVHLGMPIAGVEESLASIHRRIAMLESTTLPRLRERVVVAREALWASELQSLQAPLRADATLGDRRREVEVAERNEQRAQEVLAQCHEQRDALTRADIGRISLMLEAKHMEAIEGLGTADRLTYVCREVPRGMSLVDFAARVGVASGELMSFVDAETGVTHAYVPTTVPRLSLLKLDDELRAEIADDKTRHPNRPPRTDLMEHLAALRSGDLGTLSAMITALRRETDATEVGRLRAAAVDGAENRRRLEEELEMLRRVVAARDDSVGLLRGQNDDLRLAVKAAAERADASEQALLTAKQSVVEREEAALEATARNDALAVDAATRDREIMQLRGECDRLREVHTRDVARLQQSAEDEVKTLQARVRALEEQTKAATVRADAMREEATRSAQQLQVVMVARDEARERVDKLHVQIAELNIAQRDTENATRVRAEALAAQAQAEAALTHARNRGVQDIDNLQRQKADLTASYEAQLVEAKRAEADARINARTREHQLEQLQMQVALAEERHVKARDAALQEASVLRLQLQNTTAALATARAETEAARRAAGIAHNALLSEPGTPSGTMGKRQALSPTRGGGSAFDTALATGGSPARAGVSGTGPGSRATLRGAIGGAQQPHKILYVARPIAETENLAALAIDLGVEQADLRGPFFDRNTGRHLIYVPTIAPSNSDVLHEDQRLRTAIDESGNAGVDCAVLLEALQALRAGDTATLAAHILEGDQRLHRAQHLLELQSRATTMAAAGSGGSVLGHSPVLGGGRGVTPGSASGSVTTFGAGMAGAMAPSNIGTSVSPVAAHPASAIPGLTAPGAFVPSDTFFFGADDDTAHDSVEVLREKIRLLKEALAKSRSAEREWRALCDEYAKKLAADAPTEGTVEHVRADLEQQVEVKRRQLAAAAAELDRVRKDNIEATQRHAEEVAAMAETRRKLLAERDETVTALKKQLEDERLAHRKTLALLKEE